MKSNKERKRVLQMRFTMKYDEAIIKELREYAKKNKVTLTSAINTAISYYLGTRKEDKQCNQKQLKKD